MRVDDALGVAGRAAGELDQRRLLSCRAARSASRRSGRRASRPSGPRGRRAAARAASPSPATTSSSTAPSESSASSCRQQVGARDQDADLGLDDHALEQDAAGVGVERDGDAARGLRAVERREELDLVAQEQADVAPRPMSAASACATRLTPAAPRRTSAARCPRRPATACRGARAPARAARAASCARLDGKRVATARAGALALVELDHGLLEERVHALLVPVGGEQQRGRLDGAGEPGRGDALVDVVLGAAHRDRRVGGDLPCERRAPSRGGRRAGRAPARGRSGTPSAASMVSPVVASRRAHAGPICAGALSTPKPGIRPIVALLEGELRVLGGERPCHRQRVSSVPPP